MNTKAKAFYKVSHVDESVEMDQLICTFIPARSHAGVLLHFTSILLVGTPPRFYSCILLYTESHTTGFLKHFFHNRRVIYF